VAAASKATVTFGPGRRSTAKPVLKKTPDRMPLSPVDASALAPAGYPGPSNSGVPAGVVLSPSGSLLITRDGTVVDGLDINGCVSVQASNVTISRSRIHCTTGKPVVGAGAGARGLVVRDSELDAGGVANATYATEGITLLRNDMHNLIDGPRITSNTRIEGNWIHDLVRVGDSHNDALQSLGASNVVIRGNTLQAYSFGDPHNAAIMIGSPTGPALSNWLVEGNFMDGGNVMINLHADAAVAGSLVFRDNAFGTHSRYDQTRLGLDRAGVTWASSNVWAATGLSAQR
jgi:hypothetical protein